MSHLLFSFSSTLTINVATSIDCERAFSLAGRVVSPLQASLGDESVRACVLLNSWSQIPGLLGKEEMQLLLEEGWKRTDKIDLEEVTIVE